MYCGACDICLSCQNKGLNVKVPWCFRVAEIASLTYAAGVVLITVFILAPAFCEQDSDLSLYILPILIILRYLRSRSNAILLSWYRNPEVLRIVEHILNALASAGIFLTMWFHMYVEHHPPRLQLLCGAPCRLPCYVEHPVRLRLQLIYRCQAGCYICNDNGINARAVEHKRKRL